MAGRKAAAKAAPPEAADDAISPELVEAREAARAAEPAVKETPPDEPGIDPALVEARERLIAYEKDRDAALAQGVTPPSPGRYT